MKTRRDDSIMAQKMKEAYDRAYRESKQETDLNIFWTLLVVVASCLLGWFVVGPLLGAYI